MFVIGNNVGYLYRRKRIIKSFNIKTIWILKLILLFLILEENNVSVVFPTVLIIEWYCS